MYNSMTALPYIPYNIMKYLALNEEILWKLLKYNTYDALSKPSLTFQEKMDLIWAKDDKQEKYNVFFTNLVEDAITQSKTIMKLYKFFIDTDNIYNANVVYQIDFLYGGNMAMVECNGIPVPRDDLLIQRVLETLNGVAVGGVGMLQLNTQMSRYSSARTTIGNDKTFTGASLFLVTQVGGTSNNGC